VTEHLSALPRWSLRECWLPDPARDSGCLFERGQRGQMAPTIWVSFGGKPLGAPLPKPPAASGRAGRAPLVDALTTAHLYCRRPPA